MVLWRVEQGKRVKWNHTCMDGSHAISLSSHTVQISKASSSQVCMRNRRCSRVCPQGFADRSIGSITAGTQWLVWNFESDSTLGAAVEGRLGSFPACISEFFLSNPERFDDEERDFKVMRSMDWRWTVRCFYRLSRQS